MTKYFFLGAALPPLQIGVQPEISFHEFEHLLHDNLWTKDERQMAVIRRLYDLENMRSFWKKEKLDLHGNMDENELEEALLAKEGLPEYVVDYLDKYDSIDERLKHFPGLIARFFREEILKAKGFLREYLIFERSWRLVFAALRAKALKRDIINEMQFEDPDDDLVALILAQKDAKTFDPPEEFQGLKALFEAHQNQPYELYQALCAYRFNYISELLGLDEFSQDKIMGYMAQLILVEKWMELDRKKGLEVIEQLMKEAK